MSENANKRLLIVSHNCLSKTGSNGRTLSNYLVGWDKSKIAQFYIHFEKPDFDICENYFCITDKGIMRSILKRIPAGKKVVQEDFSYADSGDIDTRAKESLKNSLVRLVREIAWMSELWNKKTFEKWVADFDPEVILFQAGDSAFLFRIVRKLAGKYNIPVVIYNTEGYYFKNKSYMPEKWVTKPFYGLLHRIFVKQYKKILKYTKKSIYNCDLLCEDYNKAFNDDGVVIMNTSEFTDEPVNANKEKSVIYAGNLGLFRHKSLIEFADALQQVDPDLKLTVYGKANDESVIRDIEACQGIDYKGVISYDELKVELSSSKYLLHVESFDDYYKEDLKYAFSTKIADSLASGSCLFVYAPDNMAVCKYLKKQNLAVLIDDKTKLKENIKKALDDKVYANGIMEKGRAIAVKNHNISKNRIEFQRILQEV